MLTAHDVTDTMPIPPFAGPIPATVAAARIFLDAALREEGEALGDACAGHAGSTQRIAAMRRAQAAHARSAVAICTLRALTQNAERIDAASRSAREPG
jgi:hypothetical protein